MRIVANKYTEAEIMKMLIQATDKSDEEIGKIIGKARSTVQ